MALVLIIVNRMKQHVSFDPMEGIPINITRAAQNSTITFKDRKQQSVVTAAMVYAIQRSQNDPMWAKQVLEYASDLLHEQSVIDFIILVIKDARIPSLTNQEKESMITFNSNQIFDFLINRTQKIGNFSSGVERLKAMKSWNIDLDFERLITEYQKHFVERLSNHQVCQRFGEINKKHNIVDISRKKQLASMITMEMARSNKKFISIDMQTGNFSIFFYFWGYYCLGLEPDYVNYDELARTITDNECLITSKELRGSSFGKLIKIKELTLEKTLIYIMSLIYQKLIERGANIFVFNLDEIILEEDRWTPDDINNILSELEDKMGKYMVKQFRIEYFTLDVIKLENKKELIHKKVGDSTRVYNLDPATALFLIQN
jgi:uncharacterized protein (UPF0147 family)